MSSMLRNDPRQYDDLAAEWWRPAGDFELLHWLAAARSELIPPAGRPGAVLVDAGCGGGLLAPHVDGKGYRHVGVDLQRAGLRQAAEHGVRPVNGDVTALPIATGAADVVAAGEILEHVTDLPAAVAELARVLRPGGRLVATTNGGGHMAELWEIARAVGLPMSFPEAVDLSFRAENAVALLGGNFDDIELIRYEDELVVPTPEPIVAYLASCVDRDLTDEEFSALHNEVAGRGPVRVRKHSVLVGAGMLEAHT